MKKFVFGIFLAWILTNVLNSAFAKEITILYTGSTHSMLYPCSCPIESDGGVSRRATLIRQLRKNNSNILVLDSGNFYAGGLMDEYTQNTELNIQRTEVNLKAMELIEYDAVALGEDEFNFGLDFLKENIFKSNLNFLSCNISSTSDTELTKKILPYIIKRVGGLKIGIIGLTNNLAKQRAGDISLTEPGIAVKKAVEELKKNNTDILVVLSNLGETQNLDLINEIKGIDILITNRPVKEGESYKEIGSTFVFNPSRQGRKLGILTLSVKNGKITVKKSELKRLSDKIKNNSQIEEILPGCFSDNNCKNKSITGTCLNPGAKESKCVFSQAKKVSLLVITMKNCLGCDTKDTVNYLNKIFPGITPVFLFNSDAKAIKLISKLGITGLPAYLLGKEIEQETGFSSLKKNLYLKGDFYLLNSDIAGLSYYLNREKKEGSLDLFISLYGRDTSAILEAVKDFNPDIHFLAIEENSKFQTAAGSIETEEYLRCVCVKKYYPKEFLNYLICRAKNIQSSWWDNCLGSMDSSTIKTCATSVEGDTLLRENIKINKELKVIFGPTYLLDNRQIFGIQGVPAKSDFKRIFKK